MKIWPFDEHLDKSNGHWITNKELDAGLKPFRQVREAVGNDINLMADIHTNWDVPNAIKIAKALKEYDINWVEDPVRPNVEALTQFRNEVKVPLATGETMGAASNYLPFLQKGLIDYMMFDPIWLGIMMTINLQTSFLTPPFGFALFYLRGVAPQSIKTQQIYRGVIPFVILQILMLFLLAVFPEIVTWLPNLIYQ